MKIIKNQRGQGLIEYIVLVALLAVATIGITRVLGQVIKKKYTEISYAIAGEKRKLSTPNIDTHLYQKSDLGNFMRGAAQPKESGSDE